MQHNDHRLGTIWGLPMKGRQIITVFLRESRRTSDGLLEGSLGGMLCMRSHRGMMLTEAGRAFLQDARHIAECSRKTADSARKAEQKGDMLIRVGTFSMTPGHFLTELWPRICKQCTDIRFEFVSFENTPEKAREILGNLGHHIDTVPGVFEAV